MIEKCLKKLFGGLNLTWPKVIIAAVLAGVYTAAMAIIPALHYTSFNTIIATLEVWILFGILIIMNSKSNVDSGLKCFVFFLISQPLVYLLQVPFSWQGWNLFQYYKFWFVLTVLCFPMGFVGYYMKKGKWWGYLILLPMVILTVFSYYNYSYNFLFYRPRYILICLFCIAAAIVYPLAIFQDKKIRRIGLGVSIVLLLGATVLRAVSPPVYHTHIMANGNTYTFDDSYTVSLGDEKYGQVQIVYMDSIQDYLVQADFRRAGETTLTLTSPDGEAKAYDLKIEIDTYKVTEK